jgi:NAD(P)-dependent dehydrogenase (short-subunit alcohol dehydrogenase family)
MSTSSLSNKVAVVTGGSRGLGRGIVEALVARGARVHVVARGEEALGSLAREVRGVVPVKGDAVDETLAERLLSKEAPDLVVLCAGVAPALGALQEQTWEGFETNWNVDTKSTFLWLRLALRLPLKPGTHLIVISSGAAMQGSPASGGYASAKRAQWFLADYAATESARAGLGLRIHCLLPSLNPSTPLGRAGIGAYAQRAGISPEEFTKKLQPVLTPELMGKGVLGLIEAPESFQQLAYRIGGAGVAALG